MRKFFILLAFILLLTGCSLFVEKSFKSKQIMVNTNQPQITDFVSCVAAGNPVMESYPRQCSANGQTFTEILKQIGESCSQSIECQVPGEYAILANCPYQAFCYQDKCVVACPMWEDETNQWKVACQDDSQCNCSGWDTERKYACACIDGQCVSVVAGDTSQSQKVCSQEEKICPDGTPVYRTGPNCEFADCPLPAPTKNKNYDCQLVNGDWLDQYQECEYVSKNWCDKQGGVYDECASACRHNPKAQACTMQCVPVCKFQL